VKGVGLRTQGAPLGGGEDSHSVEF
jgi:hypothetical protein